jgi:hypothetical protein
LADFLFVLLSFCSLLLRDPFFPYLFFIYLFIYLIN